VSWGGGWAEKGGGGRTVGRGDEWEGVRMRYCSGGGGGGGVTGRERAV